MLGSQLKVMGNSNDIGLIRHNKYPPPLSVNFRPQPKLIALLHRIFLITNWILNLLLILHSSALTQLPTKLKIENPDPFLQENIFNLEGLYNLMRRVD